MDQVYQAMIWLGGGFFVVSFLLSHLGGSLVHGIENFSPDVDTSALGHAGTTDVSHHETGMHGHEHDGDAEDLRVNPISLRSGALFLFSAGLLGHISHSLLTLPLWISLISAFAAGLVSVWLMLQLTIYLLRQAGSEHSREDDFELIPGEVITTIPAVGLGEVALTVRGMRENWSARSEDEVEISAGQRVTILRKEGSHVVVVPVPENFD